MKRLVLVTVSTLTLALALVMLPAFARGLPDGRAYAQVENADKIEDCPKNSFFGLKPWFYYLPLKRESVGSVTTTDAGAKCVVDLSLTDSGLNTNKTNVNKLWLIGIVIFEDLLRIAGLVAVIFVIYGGIRYTTSQGEPDNTRAAQSTILNAIIGLVIAFIGASVVAFIGNRLGAGP